jgi:ribosomal-protein-alanine N-acetyltransferase
VSAVVQSSNMNIRPMTMDDIDVVMAIELSVYAYPWTKRILSDCMRVGYACRVAEIDGILASYCIMSTGADEAHILNLCVADEFQRRGLGQFLLTNTLDEAKEANIKNIFLEVRPSNYAAIMLYENLGFNQVGTRKDYYPTKSGREDAVILAKDLEFWD